MGYVTKTFSKETLLDILHEDISGYEIVENEVFDTSRWSTHYSLVFSHAGKYYSTTYSCGSTEQQDESPFEYEPDEIECYECLPVETVVVKYVAIGS